MYGVNKRLGNWYAYNVQEIQPNDRVIKKKKIADGYENYDLKCWKLEK